jgi:hypothetical protein
MKTKLAKLLLITALMLGFSLSTRAANGGVTVLDDHQLATIKGGFCPFEICEDAPGTGICQTIPPATLCDLTRCVYSVEAYGTTDVYKCLFDGEYTCSSTASYRQCILHFSLSACSYGNDLQCGFIVQPGCTPDIPNRSCLCHVDSTDVPCDWTDCVGY